jgi:3-methyl-2-oxobutanoate hydroxymethyltransferase
VSSHREQAVRRLAAPDIAARKGGVPIVCLTAYTAPMADLLDEHCDVLLVGDSVGMVVHGLPNTVGVTLEMMILHGRSGATSPPGRSPSRTPRGSSRRPAPRR